MIIKDLVIPLEVLRDEALLKRILQNHPRWTTIEHNFATGKAGFKGEEAFKYYLKMLPHDGYYIFRGLRLEIDGQFFQIDTLILTTYFAAIFEVKYFSGTLLFENNQFFRVINGSREKFPNPILQAKRQRHQLLKWMKANKLIPIPIEYYFVNSNLQTAIEIIGENDEIDRVIDSEQVFDKIDFLHKSYPSSQLSPSEIRKMNQNLIHKHTPKISNVLQTYSLNLSDIRTGVQCPNCSTIPMSREYSKWVCSNCEFQSKDAHRQAIYDYILLISPTISNRECREFLHISSRRVANYLLSNMNLQVKGSKKGIVYSHPTFKCLKAEEPLRGKSNNRLMHKNQ